ncbi:MAG: adaptor protein MecA [Clostridia bacterium]|nr:adaptor protein MecA [Clostridia bacterium]
MKIERISDYKLKITLRPEDMLRWNISCEALSNPDPDANEMFWDILHQAEEETGIVFENCKLTVEALQKDDSTFIMYITKTQFQQEHTARSGRRYKVKSKPAAPRQSVYAYQFETFDDVCAFCTEFPVLHGIADGYTDLFKYRDKYYLVFHGMGGSRLYQNELDNYICEFAQPVDESVLFYDILQEHGTCIIRNNAVLLLYQNF